MARYPEKQTKLREEAQKILKGEIAQGHHVEHLHYTKQVIQETMRLYPPVGLIARDALKTEQIDDLEIKKGDAVLVPLYALHRSRRLWENPDDFLPERFAPDQDIERFSFLPFADGPRVCIGAQFAYMEAIIILSTLIDRYEFKLEKGCEPEPVMIFTVRPEGGVKLSFKPT